MQNLHIDSVLLIIIALILIFSTPKLLKVSFFLACGTGRRDIFPAWSIAVHSGKILEKKCLRQYIITMEELEEKIGVTPESLIGAGIDGYRLESVLGCGSYGVVYLARHLMMDRLFAFKILQAEFSENLESVREFFRESKVAAKLEHPNIVQAFKAGKTPEGVCYFVMEYVDGCSIEDIRVRAPEQLSIEFLLKTFIQLADAMQYAWDCCRIVHRDIKPENLLIRNSDRKLKLADLGLAGAGNVNRSGEIVATPLYMSPEAARGELFSEMTGDIYSFGVMFYELCAGVPPFSGSIEELQSAHLYQPAPPLLSANPDLDPRLASFIDSMLAKDPAARPQSWLEVGEKLRAMEKIYSDRNRVPGSAGSDVASKLFQTEPGKNGNHPLTGVVLSIVVAVILLAVFWLIFR